MALVAGSVSRGVRERRKRLATACGLMLAAALLAGCNSLMNAGSIGPNAAIVGKDVSSGPEEHARIVAAYGGIYHDAKLEQNVARIVGRIVAASDQPDQPYRITILNAPAINAFALPGGYLYVTRGLLAREARQRALARGQC